MIKISIKPIAFKNIAIATFCFLGFAAAHAQSLPPTMPPTGPGSQPPAGNNTQRAQLQAQLDQLTNAFSTLTVLKNQVIINYENCNTAYNNASAAMVRVSKAYSNHTITQAQNTSYQQAFAIPLSTYGRALQDQLSGDNAYQAAFNNIAEVQAALSDPTADLSLVSAWLTLASSQVKEARLSYNLASTEFTSATSQFNAFATSVP